MPTSQADVEKVYGDIELVVQYVKEDENLIITGDCNAIVGEGIEERFVGEYGLGRKNEKD